MKRKWLNSFTVGFLTTLLSIYIYSLDLNFFHLLELKAYDFKVASRGVRPTSNKILIVGIDEKSLNELGRWPWPRTILARLIDRLAEAGVSAVGLDLLFPEKDVYVPFDDVKSAIRKKDLTQLNKDTLIQWLDEVGDSDAHLARALLQSERSVLGYLIFSSLRQAEGAAELFSDRDLELLDFSQFSLIQSEGADGADRPPVVRPIHAVKLSLPTLMDAANSAGYVSFVPQQDGVIRWVPLVQGTGEYLFPPLSLQVLKEATHLTTLVRLHPQRVSEIKIGEISVPISARGDMLINYYGPRGTFPQLSAADVISGKVGAAELEGKIVFVGATAAAIHDLHTTPYGPLFPGVEVHASVVENIIQSDFLMRPAWVRMLDMSMILGTGIFLAVISLFVGALSSAVLLAAGIITYLSVDYYLFTEKGLWIHSVYPVFSLLLVYFGITLYRFMFEEKEKRFIREAFSQYLAPTVVKRLVENPGLLDLGGERKILTAFFSDVAGFSTISEQLSAEKLVELLNFYLTEMTDIILDYEGTVDKFEGDAIIAFFGAPISYDDHAKRSCWVAIDMQHRLAEMRKQWKAEGQHELFMRIGINTGEVVVGNMGSKNRMDYTMMGDSVNLAARLEGANKQYQTYTMISEFTYAHAKDTIEVRELDCIRVMGKKQPVGIYELLGKKGSMDETIRQILPFYQAGLEHYKSQRWEEAITAFEKVLNIHEDDGPSLTYFERCITFQTNPPPRDWDGVFVMTSK